MLAGTSATKVSAAASVILTRRPCRARLMVDSDRWTTAAAYLHGSVPRRHVCWAVPMLNVLLTNDDGIEAEGLQVMRSALVGVQGVRLAVIAPDGNRSAMARSITTRRPLWVEETQFADG